MKKLAFIFLCVLLPVLVACTDSPLGEQDQAPDFVVTDLQGNRVTFKSLVKGKDLLLNFWATWCPYCRNEIPHLNQIYKKHRAKLEVVGISLGEDSNTVRSFIRDKGLEYRIFLDQSGETTKLYNIRGIPRNVLIGADGTIKKPDIKLQEIDGIYAQK
ncbi:MAG: TlpA family protein disulfide reductase [Candidatus Schekmanbacteria bacterium]|nr:TlpA family protein disulfide reductase [Candidatus Schekmanbacteria bacterium]